MAKKRGLKFWFYDRHLRKTLILLSAVFFFILFTLNLPSVCSVSEGVHVKLNESETVYGHELSWKEQYTGTFDEFGGVAVENGIGYVAGKGLFSGTQNITAFNATNGNLIWTTHINNSDGTPLIDNQGDYIYINVYASGAGNGIYKLNKTNGSIICENHNCSYGTAQSIVQSDSLIFDGCLDGIVYAYNKDDCAVNWSYNVSGATKIPSTGLYWEDTVTFGAYGGDSSVVPHFIQLNASTGANIWNNTGLGNTWDMQPSVKDGVIYMASAQPPYVIGAFNFTTGELIWNRTDINGFFSQMAIYDNRLWAGGLNNRIYSLNLDDGTTNCTSLDTGGEIYQGPSIIPGLAFFGSFSSPESIYMINTTDCSFIWSYEVGAEVLSPPCISEGMGYFAADDYNVWAFDFGAGTGEWSYIGYNSSGQSFCSDCLTEWQYVKANCSDIVDNNMTCTVKNNYDHSANVTLDNDEYKFNWYNSSDDLVGNNSVSYTFEMLSSEIETFTLEVQGSAGIDWSLETTLTESTDEVTSVAFSQDNNWIAYGSLDNNVYVHNAPYWGLEVTLTESDDEVYSVAFSQDNNWIAYGGYDYDEDIYGVYVHNVSDWSLETTLTESTDEVTSVAFSQDNNWIAYGSWDNNVYVHNVADWSLNTTLTESTFYEVTSVAFSQDNNWIAYGSYDDDFNPVVYVHNVADWSLETTLTEAVDSTFDGPSVAFSQDNNWIAYEAYDDDFNPVVYVHNVADWSLNTTLTEAGLFDEVSSVAFSQDNNWIAYGSSGLDNVVYVHNVSDWSLNTTLTESTDEVSSVAFSNDSNWIAYGSADNNVYVHNMLFEDDSEGDTTAPQITIISPTNTTYTTASIDFNISANEDLSYCKFTIDDWANNYTMTINASNTGANYTNSSIADGTYIAEFWCNDTSNNINNTENVTFTIDTGTGGAGTPDTGTGGSGYPIFKPTQEQLEKGYEKSLREKWKIQFEFNNETYTITLDDILNKSAIMNMSSRSGSEIFNLDINETKKFNLNDDDYYDLEVFLKNVKSYYEIDLVLRFIHEGPDWEEETEKEREEKEKPEFEIILIALIIALFAVIITKYTKYNRRYKSE